MARRLFPLLACCSLLPLASCGKPTPLEPAPADRTEPEVAGAGADDYVPLAVGQRRVATVEMIAADGTTARGRIVREVVGTEDIGGRTYFKEVATVTGVPGWADFTTYRRKAAEGSYCILADDPDRKEMLETPLPLKVGAAWTMENAREKVSYRVVAREAVTVGGKHYEGCYCINYEWAGKPVTATYWVSPDRGNVREEVDLKGERLRITLESFEVREPQ